MGQTSFRIILIFFIICLHSGLRVMYAQTDDPVILCSRCKAASHDLKTQIRDIPHPGQQDFSVSYYDLNLSLNPTAKSILGEVGIDVQVISDSLDEIVLDLTSNFQISRITAFNEDIGFTHTSNLIFIQLKRFYSHGELVKLRIYYHGMPDTSAFNFHTRSGKPLIWTLSQPFGAKSWWPCKNYPDDKADSARIAITVPKGLIVGSNGILAEQKTTGEQSEFIWKVSYPIASYLISIAAHDYLIHKNHYHYGIADSMEVVHYIYRDHFDTQKSKYEITTEMLSAFAGLFGEYPFINEKYGHAECPFNGGMEHQTLTSLLGPYEYLIAHELAHQWWGDMITCKDYHHIWLNEGFATYAEALWAEYKYGIQAYHDNMNAKQYFGGGTIYVPELSMPGRIFDPGLSYRKGAWVLHMLRHVVGSEKFFQILKAYGNGPKKYGVATTTHFMEIAQNVSQQDLTAFFEQWIFGEYYPVYSYEWDHREENGKNIVDLRVYQLQSGQLFTMPLDIHITTGAGEWFTVIENSEAVQTYSFETDGIPLGLTIDRDNWVLKKIHQEHRFVNHNNGKLILSVFDNGSIGFNKPNGFGNGLIFPKTGKNLLYSGSFIGGNSTGFTLDNDIVTGLPDLKRSDFYASSYYDQGDDQIAVWHFDDFLHPSAGNIRIGQKSRSSSVAPDSEYILIQYKIKNEGDSTLVDFYGGMILDLDIGYHLSNKVGKVPSEHLIFQKNDIHVGLSALQQHELNRMTAISDPQINFREDVKYNYLRSLKDDYIPEVTDDWAIMSASGPFIIEPGDSIMLSFALVVGYSEHDLIQKVQRAKQKYAELISEVNDYQPAVSSILVISPNPAENTLKMSCSLKQGGNVTIRVLDMSGRQLIVDNIGFCTSGYHEFRLNIAGLDHGKYLVILHTGKETLEGKFLKI